MALCLRNYNFFVRSKAGIVFTANAAVVMGRICRVGAGCAFFTRYTFQFVAGSRYRSFVLSGIRENQVIVVVCDFCPISQLAVCCTGRTDAV